jgi:acyl-CoA thioesterase FadM
VNLYLRLLRVLFKLLTVAPRALLDPARLRFRVWPTDCDLNLHMNNGRYLTFMDLGRVYLLGQARMIGTLWRKRWTPVLGAAEINFIRPLDPFQAFELVTRVLTWDERYFYIEQRFESRGRLCAIGMVKGVFLGRGERVASRQLLDALGLDLEAPPLPEVVRHWNELTNLKKQNLA